MIDDELLKLYAADQAERKKFVLLRDENLKKEMRKTIEANDAIRRELVPELIPQLNSPRLISARDCFYAAIIYSRSTKFADLRRAFAYAEKANNLVQFKDDHFAEQVKGLYNDLGKKIRNPSQSTETQDVHNSHLQMQPSLQMVKKQTEEEKEREKEKQKPPTCTRCGKQHFGLCPPKP